MQISEMTSRQLVIFHRKMATALGVWYFSNGPIYWLLKKLYDRYINPYLPLSEDIIKLRPMCLGKKTILLDYVPGCKDRTPLEQILVFVHECTHAVRIRKYSKSPAHWAGAYFTDDRFRALEEASPQEAEAQVLFWAKGLLPGLSLNSYIISDEAFTIAEVAYNKTINHTRNHGRGHTTHLAAQRAIRILTSMGISRDK